MRLSPSFRLEAKIHDYWHIGYIFQGTMELGKIKLNFDTHITPDPPPPSSHGGWVVRAIALQPSKTAMLLGLRLESRAPLWYQLLEIRNNFTLFKSQCARWPMVAYIIHTRLDKIQLTDSTQKVHHSTGDLNMIGHVLTIQILKESVTGILLTLEKIIGD